MKVGATIAKAALACKAARIVAAGWWAKTARQYHDRGPTGQIAGSSPHFIWNSQENANLKLRAGIGLYDSGQTLKFT